MKYHHLYLTPDFPIKKSYYDNMKADFFFVAKPKAHAGVSIADMLTS